MVRKRKGNRNRGELYVFEGPDGVGKTTLAIELRNFLAGREIACDLYEFPGRREGTLGKLVYNIHRNPNEFGLNHLDPTALQMMHVAAHVDAIENMILPSLHAGHAVILDRYWWSTWVYGSMYGARRSSLEQIIRLENQHWGKILPSKIFLVSRNSVALSKRENPAAEKYRQLAQQESSKYDVRLIENKGLKTATIKTIASILLEGSEHGLLSQKSHKTQHEKQTESNLLFSQNPKGPVIISAISPARPTLAYVAYWKFAAERQAVFFRRLSGMPPPWSNDPILNTYKFTNAYRASDRVSQYLIRNVIYAGDQAPEEVFFRTILFKIFNKIDTWKLLLEKFGEVRYSEYSFKRYNDVLDRAMQSGTRIYSAAYIMPSGRSSFHYERKHGNHLKVIESMMEKDVPARIQEAARMAEVFEMLRSFPTLGDFLAYQFTVDLNYSALIKFSENDFVVPGPGARDGIRKCFEDTGGLNDVDVIKLMTDRQEAEFERLGIDFKTLWGRRLHLIDCQNLFCETDKYTRVKYPQLQGLTGRTRIKQKYRRTPEPLEFWFPPDWGLNNRIKKDVTDDLL